MKSNVPKEQVCTIEFCSVRYADVADGSTRTRGSDHLRHRLLCADTFEHRVRADALREFFEVRHTVLAALGHDVGHSERARELLTRLVTAHGDDAFCTHLFCEHAEQADCAVTHDRDRRARLHVGSIGREPSGAHHVRQRQQTWYEAQTLNHPLPAEPSQSAQTALFQAVKILAALMRSGCSLPDQFSTVRECAWHRQA